MALKNIAQRDVSRLKTNAKGAKKVATQSYKESVKTVNNAADTAMNTAQQMYKASQNRLGNVSNTTKNKLSVGAGQAVSTITGAKDTAKANLAHSKAQTMAGISQAYNKQKAASENAYGKKILADKAAQRTKLLTNYKETITRFDTTKKCDAAIKKLKASKDPNKAQKIAYIRAQRAALLQAEKSGGRGGRGWHRWGGGGWHRWGNYGNTSADTDVQVTPKDEKDASSTTKPAKKVGLYYKTNRELAEQMKLDVQDRASQRTGDNIGVGKANGKRILPESKRTRPIARRRKTYKGVGKW